jgi:hypothetical protein
VIDGVLSVASAALGSAANNRTGHVREKRRGKIARVRVFMDVKYLRDISVTFNS